MAQATHPARIAAPARSAARQRRSELGGRARGVLPRRRLRRRGAGAVLLVGRGLVALLVMRATVCRAGGGARRGRGWPGAAGAHAAQRAATPARPGGLVRRRGRGWWPWRRVWRWLRSGAAA